MTQAGGVVPVLYTRPVATLTDEELRLLPPHTPPPLGRDDPLYDIDGAAARVVALVPSVEDSVSH
jgi:hypothetical protein